MAVTMLPSLKIKSWSEESLSNLAVKITEYVPRPIILIDGVGGSGKTTLALKLKAEFNANLVHTDDVSWCADPVHWEGEMLNGIVNPWIDGNNVSYRPTGWVKENRPGSIEIDPDRPLIIEGMGAGRKELRAVATYSIWVDTEPEIARERVVRRDMENGENGGNIESVIEFADWWDSLLMPLLSEEKSWEFADVIVSGSQLDIDSDTIMIHVPSVERGGLPAKQKKNTLEKYNKNF